MKLINYYIKNGSLFGDVNLGNMYRFIELKKFKFISSNKVVSQGKTFNLEKPESYEVLRKATTRFIKNLKF